MIFVTVGTQLPFDRLIRAVDGWCGECQVEAFAQIAEPGPRGYVPSWMAWQNFLSPEEFDQKFAGADLVIAHAGMGSIISALVAGKPVVIMPRRVALNEHRNDHQMATAEKFKNRPGVYVAMDETELPAVVESALLGLRGERQQLAQYASPLLIETVREFILHGAVTDNKS